MVDTSKEREDGLKELLCTDLQLEPWQCERRPCPEATPSSSAVSTSSREEPYLEVDCLVHEEWLTKAASGEPLPSHSPSFSCEEVHWHLQPSCSSDPPAQWKKVHICCLAKPHLVGIAATSPRGLLVPRNDDYAVNSVHTFLTHVSQETMLSSWKELAIKLSRTNGSISRAGPPPLTSTLMNQLVSTLYGMKLHRLSSSSPSPSSDADTKTDSELESQIKSSSVSSLPGNAVHTTGLENLSPLLSALETDKAFFLVYDYQRFTLFDIVTHSPAILEGSSNKPLFVVYQLLKLLSYCHNRGVTLGDLNLRNIYIDSRLWVQCCLQPASLSSSSLSQEKPAKSPSVSCSSSPAVSSNDAKSLVTQVPPALELSEAVQKWRSGYLSNFDYLMLLNYHAGRRLGDPNNHPIFPWVMDFSERNGVLRDLSSSKHRLAKGERQLDFTYQSALEDVMNGLGGDQLLVPHHVGEIASDVTYYVYLARRTPKEVLCARVRPRWVPEEYPASLEKMYSWTPDECIPEFFTDPSIFSSIHSDLSDLALPSWCGSAQELVNVHRQVLESDTVSFNLHNWIDLVFGFKLSGDAAVKAKNVYLSLVDGHTSLTNSGIVQLFRSSHPKRLNVSSAPLLLSQWESQLSMSSLMNIARFNISQQQHLSSISPDDEYDGLTLSRLLNSQGGYPSHSSLQAHHNLDDGSFEHVNYPADFESSPNISEGELSVSLTGDSSADPKLGILGVQSGSSKTSGATSASKSQADSTVLQQPETPGVPFLRRFRGRRPVLGEQDSYIWQGASIAAPNEAQPIQTLAQLEELSHFLNKSCRAGTDSVQQWTTNDLLLLQENQSLPAKIADLLQLMEEDGQFPPFEDRVSLDIAAVACTAVELCCNRHLRSTMPYNASLRQRYQTIQRLLKIGQLTVPCFLESLIETVFYPNRASTSDPVVSILPSLSANLLTQQFLPLLPFPTYFESLYNFLSELQKKAYNLNDGKSEEALKPEDLSSSPSSVKDSEGNTIIPFLCERIETILDALDQDGLKLLLLYLIPFFQHQSTRYQAAFVLTDPLVMHLARRHVQQILTPSFIRMFDLFGDPASRCGMLSRWMAEKVIHWFGLGVFLTRFLPCILESVIEPLVRPTVSKKPTTSPQSRNSSFLASEDFSASDRSSQHRLTSSMTAGHGYSTAVSLSYSNWDNSRGYDSDTESDDSDTEMVFSHGSLMATKMPSMIAYLSETDQRSPSSLSEDGQGDNAGGKKTKDDATWETLQPSQHLSLPPSQSLADSFSSSTSSMYATVSQPQQDDTLTASVEPPTPAPPPSPPSPKHPKVTRFMSLPARMVKRTEDSEQPEEKETEESKTEGDVDKTPVVINPKEKEITQRVSNVATDCASWLIWRLGPMLSTKHIVGPLLENLYRCFTGVCGARENACARNVLRCLAAPLEYYGERMIVKLYLPVAKSQVAPLIKRSTISLKAEAAVAASLTLLAMCIEKTTTQSMLLSYTEDICSCYLDPLFKLLSSPKHTFPSGTTARVIICNSAVDLLKRIAAKVDFISDPLGRPTEALMKTLQCFFECFSTAHGKKSDTPLPFPIEEHFGLGEDEEEATTAGGREEDPSIIAGETSQDTASLVDTEGKRQVVATFSKALVHVAYVEFCLLVGQIRLNNHLHNREVIGELHASYSQKKEPQNSSLLSSLLILAQPESTSGSTQGSPNASQSKTDGNDIFSYGRSQFFVEPVALQHSTSSPAPTGTANKTNVMSSSHTLPSLGRHSVSGEPSRLNRAGSHDGVTDNLGLFDTKFGTSVSPLGRDRAQTFVNNGYVGDPDCQLKGHWSDLWDRSYEGGGHKSSIRSICVLDSEHLFLSSSKDKTVKIWSLHNQGDGTTPCQPRLSYNQHQRTVSAVSFVYSLQNAVSCDGSVHLWDIETGTNLHHFSSRQSQYSTMAVLPDHPSMVVTATTDFHLQFLDLRTKSPQFTWRTHFPTGGAIRFLACTGGWVAVGNATGVVDTLDLRTGEMIGTWRPSERWPYAQSTWSEVLQQLKVTRRGNLLTSAGGGMVSLWKQTGKQISHLQGQNNTTPCLEIFGEQLVSVSSAGNVAVHSSYELTGECQVTTTKIRSKEVRSITCSASLPLNQLLLLGSESGSIVLMA